MGLQSILHILVISTIRAYRWGKLQLIKLFSETLLQLGVLKTEELGLVLHMPNGEVVTKKKENQILSKCSSKYESLVHLKINSLSALIRTLNLGVLGLGESYMDGDWDFVDSEQDITEMLYRLQKSSLYDLAYNRWDKFLTYLEFEHFNLQTRSKARKVVDEHYDLGNDLYESFLDPWMQYTCGYWANADNLDDAQLHKMDLIAKKLELKPGMKVLDIGCGWGNLCKYFAQKYGVHMVGVTISEEQLKYARNLCEGLNVEIRLQDYRDLNDKFDRIVAVGMFEHVGQRNYRTYMEIVHKCLNDDGLFLLHTIGVDQASCWRVEPWCQTYIFANSMCSRITEITDVTKDLFVMEDWHNFGQDYVRTILAWRDNFIRNWPKIESRYGKKFYRMWIFYLSGAPVFFKGRKLQLWQIVFSKDGLRREYRSSR